MSDTLPRWARVLAAMGAGALLMGTVPPLLQDLAPTAPLAWWIGRTSGLLAYVALWATMVFGVLLGSRGGGGWLHNGVVFELHKAWSLIAVTATGVHVLALVADELSGVPALASFVPFASPRLTGPVTVGTFAGWGLVAVVWATAIRAKLPGWCWRGIHATSFGTFLLALAHGALAGTDSSTLEVRVMYAATGTVLLAAVFHRLALASLGRLGAGAAR